MSTTNGSTKNTFCVIGFPTSGSKLLLDEYKFDWTDNRGTQATALSRYIVVGGTHYVRTLSRDVDRLSRLLPTSVATVHRGELSRSTTHDGMP